MKIKDLSPEDRPREKLRSKGARALTNSELLAILIGSGTEEKNATQIAQEMLSVANGRLVMLASMPLERLIAQKGIGPVRAVTIAAALELGVRCTQEQALMETRALSTPDLVYKSIWPVFRNLDHEECWAVYLNRKNIMIGRELISSGSMEQTVVDTRKILRRVIEKQASQVILVHNHPDGDPTPSKADIRQTDLVRNALSAVEVLLTDHIVIGNGSFFSFAEERFG